MVKTYKGPPYSEAEKIQHMQPFYILVGIFKNSFTHMNFIT